MKVNWKLNWQKTSTFPATEGSIITTQRGRIFLLKMVLPCSALTFNNIDISREKLWTSSVASGCVHRSYVTSLRIDVTALAEMLLYITLLLRLRTRCFSVIALHMLLKCDPPGRAAVSFRRRSQILKTFCRTGQDMFHSLHWSQSLCVFAQRRLR